MFPKLYKLFVNFENLLMNFKNESNVQMEKWNKILKKVVKNKNCLMDGHRTFQKPVGEKHVYS